MFSYILLLGTTFFFSTTALADDENKKVLQNLVTQSVTLTLEGQPEKAIPLFNKALKISLDNV